ncbi:MAG: HEAT repeat domain-containing protein [Pseudomonadota bacterium]
MASKRKTVAERVAHALQATKCHVHAPVAGRGQHRRYVRAVADTLAAHPGNVKVAERAAIVLGDYSGDEAEPLLRELLAHAAPTVRAAALNGMRRSGDARYGEAAVEMLRDPEAPVRKEALKALGAVGDEACLAPVAAHAEAETVGYLCDLARQAADEIGGRRAAADGEGET